ncbi:type II toxin-antitoxin system RelE/ParE family toxin [Stieleria varia]|uniref:type II toxin-antitoxin system RelE/ParE family toxin n=1 Tax=Stieleria varia TaxID=2528005 RepID=UPI001E4FC819|nr:type II toxin-antitoxin system RelE/ParE family toxin [Stieleria varia]
MAPAHGKRLDTQGVFADANPANASTPYMIEARKRGTAWRTIVPQVSYAPEADDDLEAIVEYIARDKPMAARDWLLNVRETREKLATQPGAGEVREGFGVEGCRSLSVGKYVVFFHPINGGIEVSRESRKSRFVRHLGRPTEGFHDTAPNEAVEFELNLIVQWRRGSYYIEGVPEGPQRKNHVVSRVPSSKVE